MRAALRLVRDEIGDEDYHEENFSFRDAARPLTELRDAEMLIETLEKLREQYKDQVDSAALGKMLDALRANYRDLKRRRIGKDHALEAVNEFVRRALAHLRESKGDSGEWHEGWEALGSGVSRVYRRGHRALRLAGENPSVANLHEWRKQSKYLWHVLQLLEPAWTAHEKDLADQFHKLSRLLGEDHDLAVLRQTLAADPLIYGGHRSLRDLFVLIDRSREALQASAFALGRQLYKDPPKVFTARIETYWKAWESGTQPKTYRSRLDISGALQQRGGP